MTSIGEPTGEWQTFGIPGLVCRQNPDGKVEIAPQGDEDHAVTDTTGAHRALVEFLASDREPTRVDKHRLVGA